jgi:hypothetical protein
MVAEEYLYHMRPRISSVLYSKIPSLLSSFMTYPPLLTRIRARAPLLEQELLSLPWNLGSNDVKWDSCCSIFSVVCCEARKCIFFSWVVEKPEFYANGTAHSTTRSTTLLAPPTGWCSDITVTWPDVWRHRILGSFQGGRARSSSAKNQSFFLKVVV